MTTPSSAETSPSPTPPLSAQSLADIVRFQFKQIPRSQIKKAPYNPRDIDPFALKKLGDGIGRFGLVEPLIWNSRTGNLVGGHQRLALIDAKLNNAEYDVPVAVVDLDDVQERELNVLLNNESTQGVYDFAKLETLFRNEGANPFAAGFDLMDLQQVFPTDTVEEFMQMYLPAADLEEIRKLAEIPGTPPPESVQQAALDIQQIKAARQKHLSGNREDLRADHLVVIVFDSAADTQTFLNKLGLDDNQQYFLAEHFLSVLGKPDLIPPKPNLDAASAGQ